MITSGQETYKRRVFIQEKRITLERIPMKPIRHLAQENSTSKFLYSIPFLMKIYLHWKIQQPFKIGRRGEP